MSTLAPAPARLAAKPDWLEIVRRSAEALRYGTVQIVVHDDRVTVVECTERIRLASARSVSA